MSRAHLSLLLLLGSAACFHDFDEVDPGVPDGGAREETPREDGGEPADDAGQGDAGDGAPGDDEPTLDGAPDACDGGCSCGPPCPADKPVCDPEADACRGCTRDAECAEGAVCIEADGTCAVGESVAFVTEWGEDVGSCTKKEPCHSVRYAIAQRGERHVIHVLGGALSGFDVTTVDEDAALVLDGEDTTLQSNGPTVATLAVRGKTQLTVEGFRFKTPVTADTPGVTVSGKAKVRFHGVQFGGDGGIALSVTEDAEVAMRAVHVGSLTASGTTELRCSEGKLSIENSLLESTVVGGFGAQCQLTVSRNRFESANDGSVRITQGVLIMENNLVIHRDGYNDSATASSMYPGSVIRFNTFINTTPFSSDGAALYCDASVVVTSNVFAYNSGHPLTGIGCETRYSVFDDVAETYAGTGNRVAPLDSLFVDRAGGDYHLAPGSVARGAAEPGLAMSGADLEGRARPLPAGTNADSGALEAP